MQTIDNYIANFVHSLSQRFSNENSLSDFTFALAKTVPEFARFICNFFNIQTVADEHIEIEREFLLEGSPYRVDLAFEFENQRKFFLENKIWDRDYHIKKYSETINKDQKISFGIISNHQLSSENRELAKQKNWEVKRWHKFIDSLNPSDYGNAQPLVENYRTYVKKVCSMKIIKEIRFNGDVLVSLHYFNNLIEKIIPTLTHSPFDYTILKEACGRSWSGFLYSIGHSTSQNQIKAWFGTDYTEQSVIIVDLHSSWNKDLNNKLLKISSDYFIIRDHKWKVSFEMSQYHEFLQADCEKQEEILRGFFEKVNSELERHLEN